MSFYISFTSVFMRFAKFSINIWHMPMVPRKAQISETFLYKPHFDILLIYFRSRNFSCGV